MKYSHACLFLVALLSALAGCRKKGAVAGGGDGGSELSTSDGPLYHCLKKNLSRCEQTSAAQLAAAKAKVDATGTPEEKKFAAFMTVPAFQSLCGKGEYGEGACATEGAVGACANPSGKTLYYSSGEKAYAADDFAFECGKTSSPETADGRPLPKPAPKRMSCFRAKTNTCIEEDFTGKSSRELLCVDNAFEGPGQLAMTPCPADKRSGSCKDAPLTVGTHTIETTRIKYAYGAPAASKVKSTCTIMKGEWTKL